MVTACLFRKKAWEDAGGYDTEILGYEDWDFWISCGEHTHFAQPAPKAIFYYRVSDKGTGAKHVARDQEIKAQIILKHQSLYSGRQIIWAKGVLAKDPVILSIPHREGIIPGFFERCRKPSNSASHLIRTSSFHRRCANDDEVWLTDSLESIYNSVDTIFFLISDRPWYGRAADVAGTLAHIGRFPDLLHKIRIVRGSWTNETDQRNAGLDMLKDRLDFVARRVENL
jgi:hypothetical protein